MDEQKWAAEAAEKIRHKMHLVAERNRHKIPYTTQDGVFDDCSGDKICWWTIGFCGSSIMLPRKKCTGKLLLKMRRSWMPT